MPNLVKFREHHHEPLSSQGRCVQDDCDYQPQQYWGWEGIGIIIKAVMHHMNGWLILQGAELQEVETCKDFLHTAGRQMCFHFGNSLRFSIDPYTIGDNGHLGVITKFGKTSEPDVEGSRK